MLGGTSTVWLVVPKVCISTLAIAFVREHTFDTKFCAFTVVWTRTHPAPRNTIEQDQNIKLLAVSHKFEGGRFVSVLRLCPRSCTDHLTAFRFFSVAGNVPVGKIDTVSARTCEGRNFLFLLDLMSIAICFSLQFFLAFDLRPPSSVSCIEDAENAKMKSVVFIFVVYPGHPAS